MDKKAFNGRFVENEGASAADLERGYSMTGDIPEIGESITNPESVRHETREKAMMAEYMDDDAGPSFEGGFLGRDDCGMER